MSSMSPEADVTVLETREASPSHFLLKVESFSLLGKHGIHRHETREFKAGGHKWKLILYPNEDKTGKDKDYISVYLAISKPTSLRSEVNAFFSIFLLDQNLGIYHYSSGRTRRFMAAKSEWGISQFISKNVMKDPSNGFLINDNCVFGVEVFIVGKGQDKKGSCPSFCKRLLDFTGVKDCFNISHVKDRSADEYCNKIVMPEGTILETRDASPTHFLMKIKSFSLLGKNGMFNHHRGEFLAGGNKWRLTICPNEGKTGIDSKYISVYLAISYTNSMQPANWEVDAVFSIFLFNQITGKYHHSLGKTRRFQAAKSEWGISDFISKKVMLDPSNGFLINNNCVFGAEIFIVQKSTLFECLAVKDVKLPFKREWKISNFSKLGDCWTSGKFIVEDIKWEVVLYPRGMYEEKGRFLEAYLQLIDYKRVNVSLSLCIKDQINNNHRKTATATGGTTLFTPLASEWGATIVELATLHDPKNGFIIHDSCLLEVELFVQAVVYP